MNATTVTVELPPRLDSWTCKILYGARTYGAGDVIIVDFNDQDSTMIIQAQCDLTGTVVTSTKPVAVFSSINRKSFQMSTARSVMQLPPVTTWGKQHVAFKTPGTGPSRMIDIWKIVTLNATTVNLFHSDTQQVETININERNCYTITLRSEKWVEIASNQPVMVMQILMSQDEWTPQDAIIHTPVEQFKTRMMMSRYLLWPHNLTMAVVRKQNNAAGPLQVNDAPTTTGKKKNQQNS